MRVSSAFSLPSIEKKEERKEKKNDKYSHLFSIYKKSVNSNCSIVWQKPTLLWIKTAWLPIEKALLNKATHIQAESTDDFLEMIK